MSRATPPNSGRFPVIQASFAAAGPPHHLRTASRPAAAPPPGPRAALAFPAPAGLPARGAGQKLAEPVRRSMEALFGADFADIRIHVGGAPASLGALAFTAGSDLFFAPGQFAPETARGRRLLGHELAHVVQQRAGRVANPLGRAAIVHDPALEAEAERMAQRAAALPPAAAPRRAPAAQPRFAPNPRGAILQRAAIELSETPFSQRRREALAHAEEQHRIYALVDTWRQKVLAPGASQRDLLLKNTCEMIHARAVTMTVLSRATLIPDNLAGEKAYFDKTVHYPNRGGDYGDAADVRIYWKASGESAHADHRADIRIFDAANYSDHEIITILIHEMQHEADWHTGVWEEGLAGADAPTASRADAYRSEFRAYWLGGIPDDGGKDKLPLANQPATNARSVSYKVPGDMFATSRSTHFTNARQQAIFWYMVEHDYEYVPRLYVTDAHFRAMVDALARPAGGNLLNSIRIDALRTAIIGLGAGDRATKYVAIQNATAALDVADKAHLADVAASQPFWSFVAGRTDATGANPRKLTTAEVNTLRTAVGL